LYVDAPSLDAVKELGLTQSLVRFGVIPAKEPEKESDSPAKKEATRRTAQNKGSKQEGRRVNPDDGMDVQAVPDDEGDTAFKKYQAALRQQTPLSRAVAIRNAVELLMEDVIGEQVEEELQDSFDQIAELAEALRGLNDCNDE